MKFLESKSSRTHLNNNIKCCSYTIYLTPLIIISFLVHPSYTRKNDEVIEIGKRKSYEMTGDTLVLDNLILLDSSKLVLTRPKSFIKVNKLIVYTDAIIDGSGKTGENGRNGRPSSKRGLCQSGKIGEKGSNGADGSNGKELILVVGNFEIKKTLMINLAGGDGGDGGNGGRGGDAGITTPYCITNGGNGGNGGNGANGGRGGQLLLKVMTQVNKDLIYEKIRLVNRGGYKGIGGVGGEGGYWGEGRNEKKSVSGNKGGEGSNGLTGREGKLFFYKSIEVLDDKP